MSVRRNGTVAYVVQAQVLGNFTRLHCYHRKMNRRRKEEEESGVVESAAYKIR